MKRFLIPAALMVVMAQPALGFFSTAGEIPAAEAEEKVEECPVGMTGNVGTTNCSNGVVVQIEVDADADSLNYGDLTTYYGCTIVNEVDGSNEDGQCIDEPVNGFTESGEYTVLKWKLYSKKALESFFRWVEKNRKKKHFARLDQYCGANGLPNKLIEVLTTPDPDVMRVCQTNYCDNTFNATSLPECNAACDQVAAENCGASACYDPGDGTSMYDRLCGDLGGDSSNCSIEGDCADECQIEIDENLFCSRK